MNIVSIITSYDSPKLTERAYFELKECGHDVVVLENSSLEELVFKSKDTIDLGRANVGFGGFYDYIFKEDKFREYDFVGILNNDIYNIPKNYLKKLESIMCEHVGIVSSCVNDEGTGWKHMRKNGKDLRDVKHIETIGCYFNTALFDEYKKYIPLPYWGIIDMFVSGVAIEFGYKLVIDDSVMITHMLSGARKQACNYEEYLRQFPSELRSWMKQYPNINKFYEENINNNSELQPQQVFTKCCRKRIKSKI